MTIMNSECSNSQHITFLIDHGFLFANFRYTIGHKTVCFTGCFVFVVAVIIVAVGVAAVAVAVSVVALGAAVAVVVAVVAADDDDE